MKRILIFLLFLHVEYSQLSKYIFLNVLPRMSFHEEITLF